MDKEASGERGPTLAEGVVKWQTLEQVDPAIAARIRAQLADPALQKQATDAAAREAAAGPIRYGLSQSPLPRGAIAAVVRNANGSIKRLFVFYKPSVSDLAFSLARHALREDEEAVPDPAGARVLFVWSDQRVEGPGITKQMHYIIPPTPRGEDAELLAAPPTSSFEVSGIGPVQIVGGAQ